MIRRPPRSTRPDTLFPYTTLFRSEQLCGPRVLGVAAALQRDLRIEALDGIAHGQCRPILGDVGARNAVAAGHLDVLAQPAVRRSEEHTSELQSLMRISYAVFCLKKKIITII